MIDHTLLKEQIVPLKHVVLDEFHVKILVIPGLAQEQADAMTRVLVSAAFRRRLQDAIVRTCREFAVLTEASPRVTH